MIIEKAQQLTWQHDEGNYDGLDESYESAYEAHEAIKVEVEIEKNIEGPEVVDGKQLRFTIQKYKPRGDFVDQLFDDEDTHHRQNRKEQLTPDVCGKKQSHEEYYHSSYKQD